jgi:hypothetical protein
LPALAGRFSSATGSPRAEAAMSFSSRRSRVSSFFALTIHQVAVPRYQAGCAWKWRQACACARKRRNSTPSSRAALRFSYE